MTATLSAELERRAARDLVVGAVLGQNRTAAQDRAVESMMLETRARPEALRPSPLVQVTRTTGPRRQGANSDDAAIDSTDTGGNRS
jgi:hypothetical protein